MKTTLALALDGRGVDLAAGGGADKPADQDRSATQQEAGKAAPLYQMKAGEWRASKLDGLDVYNTNNEKIGDISELIVDRERQDRCRS